MSNTSLFTANWSPNGKLSATCGGAGWPAVNAGSVNPAWKRQRLPLIFVEPLIARRSASTRFTAAERDNTVAVMANQKPLARTIRRREQVARARRLRDQEGLSVKDIAVELDVRPSTIYGWLTDPEGKQASQRKQKLRGQCPSCHASTSPTAAGEPDLLCRSCAHRKWTRETVLAALRATHAQAGRPLKASDFVRARVAAQGAEALARYDAVGLSLTRIRRVFGSWRAAREAAFPGS